MVVPSSCKFSSLNTPIQQRVYVSASRNYMCKKLQRLEKRSWHLHRPTMVSFSFCALWTVFENTMPSYSTLNPNALNQSKISILLSYITWLGWNTDILSISWREFSVRSLVGDLNFRKKHLTIVLPLKIILTPHCLRKYIPMLWKSLSICGNVSHGEDNVCRVG